MIRSYLAHGAIAFSLLASAFAYANDTQKPKLPPLPAYTSKAAPRIPNLPLLGTVAPNDVSRSQNVVHISNGNNEVVYVASGMPNRIGTPFANPKLVGVGEEDLSFEVLGQDVYIIPQREGPIGLFITDDGRPGRVASLTLVGRHIPSQNIVLQFEDGGAQSSASVRSEEEKPAPSTYVEGIQHIMKSLALGQVPRGFTESQLKVGATLVGGLMITPEKQYGGQRMNIYRYRVENNTDETIELKETSFNDEGVRAVAFWPDVRIEPRKHTRVFVLADNPEYRGRK